MPTPSRLSPLILVFACGASQAGEVVGYQIGLEPGDKVFVAGVARSVDLKAVDANGSVVESYDGTANLFTTDNQSPAARAKFVNGVGQVRAEFRTAKWAAMIVMDSRKFSIKTMLPMINVLPGPAAEFVLDASPLDSLKVGQKLDVTIKLRDAFGNELPTYQGPANLEVSSGSSPATSLVFTKGVARASLELTTPGAQSISVTDVKDRTLRGSLRVTVNSAISGTAYYVSNVGLDSNDGLSPAKAWATLNRVNAAKFKGGDGVFFRGGDAFSGCLMLSPKNVTSATESAGLTVDAFGSGKFRIDATCTGFQADGNGTAAIQIQGLSGVSVSNAILRGARGQADGTTYGILIYNPYRPATVMKNIRITDNDIGGFFTKNLKKYGGEIFWNTYYQTSPSIDRLLISRNVLHGVDGVSSQDGNGIMGISQRPVLGHVTIEKNLVYDIGGLPGALPGTEGNGIVGLGLDGAVVRQNVVHDVGGNVNTCGGPGGIWLAQANNAIIEENEVYRMRPLEKPIDSACDWVAYDFDYSVTNSFIQYNYSHENWGAGLLLFGKGAWGPNVARFNVSLNDGLANNIRARSTASISIGGEAGTKMPLAIYNNTVFQAENANGAGTNLSFNALGTVVPVGPVANNIFFHNAHAPGSMNSNLISTNGGANAANLVFRANTYFNSLGTPDDLLTRTFVYMRATGSLLSWSRNGVDKDPSAKFLDPKFEGALAAPVACLADDRKLAGDLNVAECLRGRLPSLQSTSPNRGAGLDLTAAPYAVNLGGSRAGYQDSPPFAARDFFGNPIPTSGGSNIGADGK